MAENPLFHGPASARAGLDAETRYADNGIVSRTLFATATTRVVLFSFDQGQQLTEHATPRAALIQILTGRCDFTVAGTLHALSAGDLLYLPPGAPHAVTANERFSMLLTLAKPDAP